MILLSYPLTLIHYLLFALCLLIFHPMQWFALKTAGYRAQKNMVTALNFCLLQTLRVTGAHITWDQTETLPLDRPLIVVANHQSLNDIPAFFWFMRAHHPKFISKIELGKGIPSISFNLRHGGNALIDRKDSVQSKAEITRFAHYVADNNYAACIFPEGTRGRNGEMKAFKREGLRTLLKNMPNALVVPVAVNQTYRLSPARYFPIPFGIKAAWKVLPSQEPAGQDMEALIDSVEAVIRENVAAPSPKKS